MCKKPGVGDMLGRTERMRDLNNQFNKLAPASDAILREEHAALQLKVEQLEQQLATICEDTIKEILIEPSIHSRMKAGCIGEFTMTTQNVCPECWDHYPQHQDEECEICNGEADESGLYDVEVVVPWTTQKEIFKKMCYFKYVALLEDRQ